MQWTMQLEARTDQGEVTTTELLTFSRPAVAGTFAEVGLMLAEAEALLATLQASMLCAQVTEYAAHRPSVVSRCSPGLRSAAAPQGPAHATHTDSVRLQVPPISGAVLSRAR